MTSCSATARADEEFDVAVAARDRRRKHLDAGASERSRERRDIVADLLMHHRIADDAALGMLALLLAIDALVPQEAIVASQAAPSVNKTVVRIRSDQKLPERVVYDTSLSTIVPPPVVTAQAPAPVAAPSAPASADAAAQARVRETFAQFVPAEAKKPEPQVQRKRKVARSRPAPMQFAQPQMRVAQQSHFGFFGGSNWNSTW